MYLEDYSCIIAIAGLVVYTILEMAMIMEQPDRDLNIVGHLSEIARARPDHVALITGAGRDRDGRRSYDRLTFAELDCESDRYAHGLTAYGIDRGKRVLLMVRPGLALVTIAIALFKAGCVPIVIDPAMGRRNLATCIAECRPDALIGIPLAHLLRLLFPDAFRSVRRYVTVGRPSIWGSIPAERLRAPGGEPFPIAPVTADTVAAILFTTGSTGVPKGAVYEHGMFVAQLAALRELYPVASDDVDLPTFPPFVLLNLVAGITSAIPGMDPTRPAAVDPAAIVEIIRDQRVTSAFGSPALWNKVSRYCCERGIRLPTLRRVLIAGAPVPSRLHQRFQQILAPPADTYTPYGATEALPMTSIAGREVLAAIAARDTVTAGTCLGRPAPGITLRIIAIDDGPIEVWDERLALPPNAVGEIVVKGRHVTKEYINGERSTRLAKIHDGEAIWHRVGDLGYLDAEGMLWFYGRKSQRVQLKDQCLYTIPCEAVFNQHPDVFRSALVSVRRGGQAAPAIVVEPEPGRLPRTAGARARFERELLALGAAQPMTAPLRIILFHPAFPVDIRHNAKIGREQLGRWAERKLGG
jgi:acyl-CoA synthetase (AMP-forming)/AMP-acid ligase II